MPTYKVLGSKLPTLWSRINEVLVPRQATVSSGDGYYTVTLQNAVTPTPNALVSFNIPISGSSGGSTVTISRSLSTGTQIATVTVDGATTTLFAPSPPTNYVSSINTKTGAVTLTATDVGALPSSTTYVSNINSKTGAVTLTAGNNIAVSATSNTITISAVITTATVTNALGYTPYNSTNPNGYTSNIGTVTGVKINNSTKAPSSGVVDLGTVLTTYTYTLPTASTTTLGGIKIGNGLSINSTGVVSAAVTAAVTSLNSKTGTVTITGGNNISVSASSNTITISATDTDTKNTVGATNTASKMYLVGTTTQTTCPQSYTNENLYYDNGLISFYQGTATFNYTLPTPRMPYSILTHQGDGIWLDVGDGGDGEAQISVGKNNSNNQYDINIHGNEIYLSAYETAYIVGPNIHIGVGIDTNTTIKNVVTPTATRDAANKAYVDSSIPTITAGDNITVSSSGGTVTISASYTLPIATTESLGGVRIDENTIVIDDAGYISTVTPTPYTLPIATTESLGGVMIDDSSITIDSNGVISSTTYAAFVGATDANEWGQGAVTGVAGLVPSPPAGGAQYLLYGDGEFHGTWIGGWNDISGNKYTGFLAYSPDGTTTAYMGSFDIPHASITTPGLMSTGDKNKLNTMMGIAVTSSQPTDSNIQLWINP